MLPHPSHATPNSHDGRVSSCLNLGNIHGTIRNCQIAAKMKESDNEENWGVSDVSVVAFNTRIMLNWR